MTWDSRRFYKKELDTCMILQNTAMLCHYLFIGFWRWSLFFSTNVSHSMITDSITHGLSLLFFQMIWRGSHLDRKIRGESFIIWRFTQTFPAQKSHASVGSRGDNPVRSYFSNCSLQSYRAAEELLEDWCHRSYHISFLQINIQQIHKCEKL